MAQPICVVTGVGPGTGHCTRPAIAEEIWHVAHQDRCAWSFNVELRPYGEIW